MKIKLRTIIRIVILLASVASVILVLRQPAPVSQPQSPAAIAANAQSFDQKMDQFAQAAQTSSPILSSAASVAEQTDEAGPLAKPEVHLTSNEVGAALAQATGTGVTPDSNLGSGAPVIKDQRVSFENDLVRGQFLANLAGKDVWVTVSGRLGAKDGYATFDPTEFKVGEMNVPVSLVNAALQKKLLEQRDRLKLPDYIGDVKVQNGELVLQRK